MGSFLCSASIEKIQSNWFNGQKTWVRVAHDFFHERKHGFENSQKKWKDSLETRTELAVLRTYVENQAILKTILLCLVSKCKQTKEQGSDLFFNFFTRLLSVFFFFLSRCKQNNIKLRYSRLQFVKKHKLALSKTQRWEPKYVDHKFFFNVLVGATCTKTWGQTS